MFIRALSVAIVVLVAFNSPIAAQSGGPLGFVSKLGSDLDVRSGARVLADELAANKVILPEAEGPVAGGSTVAQIQLRGGNLQVNDPSRDYVQIFSGFRPFVRATQSEVSTAAFGQSIVTTYNDSTGLHVAPNPSGPGLIVDRVRLSSYSVSQDGGKTWTSGSMPPAAGATQTFGDPAIAVDRHGIFYFAQLGTTAADEHGAIVVNKSADGGQTWAPGVVVQSDDASDKEWIAVGPDPAARNRDNVYVTWTSFQQNACELRFGRSTDGGSTWTARTIFVPTADPIPDHPQNCLQFSNPTVDQVTGTLYVPFLRFSNADQDFIQMMMSKDAGTTFQFVQFNVSGAPEPTVLPITQPGEFTECGATRLSNGGFSVNLRLTIHGTDNTGPGITGLPRYVQASRMVVQPATAARNNVIYLAWSNSTSLAFGDPTGGSNVLFVRSNDGGSTWTSPIMVNPDVSTDLHHVMPALAIDTDANDVHVSYYTQHVNRTVDLDMANSHDRGATFPVDRTVRVTSTSGNLPPTNIPIPTASNPFGATNYDRQIAVCYALGEYQSVTSANGTVYVGWGDTRNSITEPVTALDPISGQTHAQQDVLFQKIKVQ